MKSTRFRYISGLIVSAMLSSAASAQIVSHERLLSFEGNEIPPFITAHSSHLSLTTDHFKDGVQSLRWQFASEGSLSIKKDLHFEPKDSTDTYLSGFVVWIHNTIPIDRPLTFRFLKNGTVC